MHLLKHFKQYSLSILTISTLWFSIQIPAFAEYRTESPVSTDIGNPPANSLINASNNTCPNSPFKDMYAYDFANNNVFSPKNFGDPDCTYTKNKLAARIQQLDPKYAYCWFNVIVKNESSYDPNREQLNDVLDANHAWGNFQMGRGKNGKLDHGDVDYNSQVYNAITYKNTVINGSFKYWSSRQYDPVHCPQS